MYARKECRNEISGAIVVVLLLCADVAAVRVVVTRIQL